MVARAFQSWWGLGSDARHPAGEAAKRRGFVWAVGGYKERIFFRTTPPKKHGIWPVDVWWFHPSVFIGQGLQDCRIPVAPQDWLRLQNLKSELKFVYTLPVPWHWKTGNHGRCQGNWLLYINIYIYRYRYRTISNNLNSKVPSTG